MSRPVDLAHLTPERRASYMRALIAQPVSDPPTSWGAFWVGVLVFGALWAALAWCAGVLP